MVLQPAARVSVTAAAATAARPSPRPAAGTLLASLLPPAAVVAGRLLATTLGEVEALPVVAVGPTPVVVGVGEEATGAERTLSEMHQVDLRQTSWT